MFHLLVRLSSNAYVQNDISDSCMDAIFELVVHKKSEALIRLSRIVLLQQQSLCSLCISQDMSTGDRRHD